MEEDNSNNSENLENAAQNDDLAQNKEQKTLKEEAEEIKEQSKYQFFKEMSRDQKMTVITFSICNITVLSMYGMLAPFFPAEVSRKGISSVWVGFILSLYEATIALTAPIFGSILTRVGAKKMYACGILFCGICSILFGFLNLLPDGNIFLVMCLFMRFLQGLGGSAYYTANFAIIANMFPKNVAAVFGILQLFMGLGVSIGPVLGGSLHQVGGYMAPFATVGSLVTAVGLLSIFFLPKYAVADHKRKGSIWNLMKVPLISIVGFCLVCSTATFGLLDVALSTYLKKTFKLSDVLVGLVFLIYAASFALSGPFYGFLSDKYTEWTLRFVMYGSLITGLFLHLIGPAPFLHIPHTLWLTLVSVGFMGSGVVSVLLSFPFFVRAALEKGYPNDLATFGLCSGLFNSFFATGTSVGPIISGILVDQLSFEAAASIWGECDIVAGLILMIYLIYMYMKQKNNKEEEKICDTSRRSSTITQFSQLSEISEETQLLPNPTSFQTN